MKRSRKILAWMGILLAAAFFTSCASIEGFTDNFTEDEDTIKIGVFQPMSGNGKEEGMLEVSGIELAHELYPQVLDKPVELVYADNRSDPDAAETAAQELVDQGVSLVLGSYGNTLSLVGSEIFQQAEIPQITVTCTNPLVTQGNPYAFRVSIVDSFQGTMAAKYVYNELKLEKATVMRAADDDPALAMAQQFSDKMTQLTGDEEAVPLPVEYPKGTEDFTKYLKVLEANGCQVVYLPGDAADSAKIITQARARGLETKFLGTDAWESEEFLEEGGQALEGAVFTCYFDANSGVTETTEVFLQAYREKYGEEALPTEAEALAFDAYLLAISALENGGGAEGNAIREALAATSNFQGATGSITWDENGDPIKSVSFKTVKDGAFVFLYTAEPQWGKQ